MKRANGSTIPALIDASWRFLLPPVLVFILSSLTDALYDRVWWYDIPMHLAGGAAVALGMHLALASLERRKLTPRLPPCLRLLFLVAAAALVGVAWELYEFLMDLYVHLGPVVQPSVADTMKDFANDLIGAVAAGAAAEHFSRK